MLSTASVGLSCESSSDATSSSAVDVLERLKVFCTVFAMCLLVVKYNEQNRQKLEELQQRKIGSFWSIIVLYV